MDQSALIPPVKVFNFLECVKTSSALQVVTQPLLIRNKQF